MRLLDRLHGWRHAPGDARCPEHGTPMVYSPRLDMFACNDKSCRFFHGVSAGQLESILADAMKEADASTPLGQWTQADVERHDLDQIGMAIGGGHLRDSGIAPPPGARRCGLHGEACESLVGLPLSHVRAWRGNSSEARLTSRASSFARRLWTMAEQDERGGEPDWERIRAYCRGELPGRELTDREMDLASDALDALDWAP